jgi:hypothetical protein
MIDSVVVLHRYRAVAPNVRAIKCVTVAVIVHQVHAIQVQVQVIVKDNHRRVIHVPMHHV